DDGVELGQLGLVDEVALVLADHREVGGDRDHGQVVGVGELRRLRLGGARHAGQLLVETEVVLEGHRGPGVVLLLDLHPLLGLDRLVQAVGPAATFEGAPGELVDDLHLAGLDDVVLVALVQLLGAQRLLQLVHQVGLRQVVEVVDAQLALDPLDALLGGGDRLLLLVDLVVDLAGEAPHDAGELVVEAGRLGRRAADDQRCAGLVDEDRVDLVDDAEHVTPLHHLGALAGHVVAQVVEAELGVGAVGDVAAVGDALEVGIPLVGPDQAHGEAEELVDAAPPLGVEARQVVVDRDQVHAPLGEAVEVDGQGRHKGLALARLHLRDPAEVEGGAAHELHVEVALADDPLGRLPDHGEGRDEQVVHALGQSLGLVLGPALGPGELLPELDCLVRQRLVAQGLELGLHGVDVGHQVAEGPDLLAFTGAENLAEHAHCEETVYVSGPVKLPRLPSPQEVASPVTVLGASIGLYSLVFGVLTWQQQSRFATFGFDMGIFDQGIWLVSRFKDPFVTVRGLNYFGNHVNVITVLFVPFYWLGAGPHFLYLIETLALAAGAIPIWLLARDRLANGWLALGLSTAYLLNPSIQWINWWHFHPDALAVTPLLFAYWLATKKRWGWFSVAALAALMCKEDAALALIGLGVVLAIRGHRR